MTQSDVQKVQEILHGLGITRFGFTVLQKPPTIDHYEKWLEAGMHAGMEYLKRHLSIKKEPQSRYKNMNSAIVMAFDYYPHPKPTQISELDGFRIASYARGADYHDYLTQQIEPCLKVLQQQFPSAEFQFVVDSSPVLERDLAYRAGLGWFGKNTCLINEKHGSLFIIAEILTSLDLSVAKIQLAPDRCGTCTRCIDACPTNAITEPHVLDANKCISYLTIEKKGEFNDVESKQIGNWLFGCDICQTICPWNEKVFGKSNMQSETYQVIDKVKLQESITALLQMSDIELEKLVKSTPLSRPKARGIQRNLRAIARNLNLSEN